jgi:hypothetical protein
MPRDLGLAERAVPLTESPNPTEESEDQPANGQFIIIRNHDEESSKQPEGIGKIHPYTRPLTVSDLESCVALENAAFPREEERCSREKVS